jgi:hypothetical protein
MKTPTLFPLLVAGAYMTALQCLVCHFSLVHAEAARVDYGMDVVSKYLVVSATSRELEAFSTPSGSPHNPLFVSVLPHALSLGVGPSTGAWYLGP